ncbi:pyridine nucleotide-disulfide oxidoreductase [Parafrankia colletiae]|uniref:Pyridine nucleotide-disulfide oxidoreductase n=1 Tax=Parafrankia colletiae TaxID=573497 RepID=A0A1S1QKW2_9ACTN|nr:FAD/NAD(P)-binding protein [Parafrankia colletiae]MCK9901797.1 FAD/NAD(P)-binding protein [Frankia sp. Cpl3]OHV34071.1 pyridine nucleotide-disulfide oxidoreductase [Parafrankia colletiae]
MSAPVVVAVVGGGASGCLATAHLARSVAGTGRRFTIMLVEPDDVGAGLAYLTRDPRHRLNVPAAKMSAFDDDPQHFLRWLRRHVAVDFPPGGFAPRQFYAEYLRHTLEETLRAATGVQCRRVHARATDVRRHGRRLRLTLDNGTSHPVDAVVLALGHGAPTAAWAPPSLARSPRFVGDPWRAETQPHVPAGSDVLLVGAGLTMADMAQRWSRAGVRLHVTSRHGLLPLSHALDPAPPLAAPELPEGPVSLAQARRLVFDHIRAAGGDWRRAVDSMRPVTAELWSRLDPAARSRFVATTMRRWDQVRHRVAPAVHAWLEQRRAEGSLVVHAAQVVDARNTAAGVEVSLSDGSRVLAAAVVNCTGAGAGVRTSHDPLVMNLLAAGLATPDGLDLGFATEGSGRLVAADGPRPAIWAIGPLRRGELWESTAIPEIRGQAASLARAVIAALPGPRVVRRVRDPYGLPLTATPEAAGRYVAGLGRILRVRSGAEMLVAEAVAADPQFALGQAVLALLGAEWGADVDVETALLAAQRQAARADERERRFIEVVTARIREPGGAGSAAALLSYVQAYPEDALAVSIAVPTIAFSGATEIPAEAWALVEGLAAVYRDDWWYRGLLAFTRQEQENWEEAAELAALALAVEPTAGHAVHAKTHVHYETGDHEAGLAWLDGWISTCGSDSSHRAHFAWHAALHELALGDDSAARARFSTQLSPPAVSGVRALVDSASLLWRGFTAGAWTSVELGPVLETVPGALLVDPPTPFVGLHAAVALAAAGDCRRLAQLRRSAAARSSAVFTDTVAPLADALMHLLHGDPDRATDALIALPGVERLGGSAAQREIVEDTTIYCAIQANRPDVARSLLQARLERRCSPRDVHRRAHLLTAQQPAR